jgi:hypothetical protein
MTPQQTNNTAQYDAEAAEARRNAERRELKNKRNRAGLNQTNNLSFIIEMTPTGVHSSYNTEKGI